MEEFIREIFRNLKGGIIIKISKFLTIVLALITALLIFDRSSGCTNNDPSSWFGDSVSSEGTVNIGGSNPSTMPLKTINGESLQGYGNINIDMDSVVDVDELPSNKVEWKGTIVPNSGIVESVYFNTNLTNEEVDSLLSQLNYDNNGALYLLLSNSDMSVIFGVQNKDMLGLGIGYYIFDIESNSVYDSEIGWNENYKNYTINSEVVNEVTGNDMTLSVGTQNELLNSLFSITPIEYVEPEIDKNSIYRVNNGVEVSAYKDGILLPSEISHIFVVDDLPESGVDFFYEVINFGSYSFYYNTGNSKFYIYSGEITSSALSTELNSWILLDLLIELEILPISIVTNKNEIDYNNNEILYLLITNYSKYYVYDNEWIELITTCNIDVYKPKEQHLYEHYIEWYPDVNEYKIEFVYLSSEKTIGLFDFFNSLILENDYMKIPATGYYCENLEFGGTQIEVTHLIIRDNTVYVRNILGEEYDLYSEIKNKYLDSITRARSTRCIY